MSIEVPATYLEVITTVGVLLSGLGTCFAIYVAYTIHKNQKTLSQRQLLLPLWDHMSTLSEINSDDPIIPDVIKVINTFELVALCCEGKMVDENVIKRTFKVPFMAHYESIKSCGTLKDMNKTGEALLNENLAARKLYKKWDDERLSHGTIK